MTASVLPVSNIINISLTTTPTGLAVKNVNNVAIFTTDQPLDGQPFSINIAPSQVIANYGTNSVTTQMANNVFAQPLNPLSGGGSLIIIPMRAAVSATEGNFTTANISANLAAIIAVANGDLTVTTDTVAQNLTNLNFTNCVTLADIAAIFDAAMIDCDCSASGNTLIFSSHKVGTDSTVALATYAGGGTDLHGAGFLDVAAGASTPGANSSGETLLNAIARTQGAVAYVGVMSTLNLEDAVVLANAAAIQAMDMLYYQHFASTQDILGVITTIQQAGQTKTRCLLYTTGQSASNLMKAAYGSRLQSVDFTGSNTSSTMNLKTLVNVDPDPGITQTLYDEADTAGADLYVSYDGVPSVFSTGGNGFADEPYSELAFKFALQAAGFNYLRQTNTKIPQTEPGMTGLKSAYAQVCIQFVTNGWLAPGAWDSPETFGSSPQIFLNNITQSGYYIYSAPIALQNSIDRQNRIAPLVQIAAKEAGAIHKGSVLVTINP